MNHTSDSMKDWGDHLERRLRSSMAPDVALSQIKKAGSINISPELFEKVCLSPQLNNQPSLRGSFGNPAPIGLIGFLVAVTPESFELMGWRGTTGNLTAGIGAYIFFGGVLMTMAGLGEWLRGDTFSFVVFCSYGAYWFADAATMQPFYGAFQSFSPNPDNPAAGATAPEFLSSVAFFYLVMGFLSLVYMICALRTDITHVIIFFTLFMLFCLLAGAEWQIQNGNDALGWDLTVASGVFGFVSAIAGWYMFIGMMLESVDFPLYLPLGDLSTVIRGMSERRGTEIV